MTRVYICNRSTRRPRPLVAASLTTHRPMNRKQKLRRCLSSPSMNEAASLGDDNDNCQSVCHLTPDHLDDHDNCQSVCRLTPGHQPSLSANMRRAHSHNDSLHKPPSTYTGTNTLQVNHHLPLYTCLEKIDKSLGANEKIQRERKDSELVHLKRECSSRGGLDNSSRNGMGDLSRDGMDMGFPSPPETCGMGTLERSNSAQLGFSWQTSEDVDPWQLSPTYSDRDVSLSTIRQACLLLLDPHRRLSPNGRSQPLLANTRRVHEDGLQYFQNSQFVSADSSYDDWCGVSLDSQDEDDETFTHFRNDTDVIGIETEGSDNEDELIQFKRSVLCRKLSGPDTPRSPYHLKETAWSFHAHSPDMLPTKSQSYKNLLDIGWCGLQCALCRSHMEIPPFASNYDDLYEDGSDVSLSYPSRPNGREGLVTLYCPGCDRLRQVSVGDEKVSVGS